MLVAAKRVEQALEWIPFITEDIHNQLADFLCNRGFYKHACMIPTVTPSKRFNLCLKYGMVPEAIETIEQISQLKTPYDTCIIPLKYEN